MIFCNPDKVHEWTVSVGPGQEVLHVKVEFDHAACFCSDNPGRVTVEAVKALDEDGQETGEDLLLMGTQNPGCVRSSCCGCPGGFCGCNDCFCCTETRQMFKHSGRLFEVAQRLCFLISTLTCCSDSSLSFVTRVVYVYSTHVPSDFRPSTTPTLHFPSSVVSLQFFHSYSHVCWCLSTYSCTKCFERDHPHCLVLR